MTEEKFKKIVEGSGYSVNDVIAKYRSWQRSYPDKPNKPLLSNTHTSAQAVDYVKKLQSYEDDMTIYKQELNKVTSYNNNLMDHVILMMKCEAGLEYSELPRWQKDRIWTYAWQKGHSGGLGDVYGLLLDLMELFEE